MFSFNYQKVYTPVTGFVINKETGLRNAAVPVVLYESAEGNKIKIDSTVTDRNGNYSFNVARPNRIYEVIAYEHPQLKAMNPQMVNIKTPAVASTIQAPVLFVGQPAIDALPKAPVVEPVLAKAPAPAAIEANKPGLVLDSVYFIIYFDFDLELVSVLIGVWLLDLLLIMLFSIVLLILFLIPLKILDNFSSFISLSFKGFWNITPIFELMFWNFF